MNSVGKKGLAKYVLEGHRPALEKHWPDSLQKLLSDCWHEVQAMRPRFRDIIAQWDTITTDMLCPDPWGREVARRLWPEPSSAVTFSDFLKAFYDICMPSSSGSGSSHSTSISTSSSGSSNSLALGSSRDASVTSSGGSISPNSSSSSSGSAAAAAAKNKQFAKYLSALLCESSFDDSVSKQRWCNVVGWFAPIDQKTACRDFFHRIQDLFSQSYFHGFLSEQKAEHQLKQLWESTSGFILTFIDYIGHIQHEKITNRNGMWYVEGICEEFDSWKKVKNAFKQVWNIGVHLPKSPYQGMFKRKRF